MDVAPADVARIRELYSQGHYRQAHAVATEFGPLRAWTGTPARLIGGRLAIQLGAPTLGRRLHLLAFRATPAHPEAIYYHARYRMERFGPLATWSFLRKHPDWSDALPELHADWLALTAFIAARLRDFDRAERWLNRAEAVAPDRPWPCIERSSTYELADRVEDALVAARRSLELHAWFRPGVQSVAHLLLRLGRDHEALDFLTEAASRLESGLVTAQLAAVQNDLGHHSDARRTLDRYAELSPLMEPETAKWLAARRADTAYFLGERATAAEHARNVKDEFYDAFAEKLAIQDSPPRQQGTDSPPRQQGTDSPPRQQWTDSPPRQQWTDSPPRQQGTDSPPRQQGSDSPPRQQGSDSPPRQQGTDSPPRQQGTDSPPRQQGSDSPPRQQGSDSPPRQQGSDSPPRQQGTDSPPRQQGTDSPPRQQGTDSPPRQQGDRSQESGVRSQETGDILFLSPNGATVNSQGREPLEPRREPPEQPRKSLPLDVGGSPPPTAYDLLARFWTHPLPNPTGDTSPSADGLPDAAERNRVEQAGWVTREFSLTIAAAVDSIGRDIPFLITLVEAGFSQPRLCVGVDAVRATVLLADGLDRRPVEAPVAGLIERFSPFGPRCLVLVPPTQATKLAGLTLPDGAEREALYAVQKPLLTHDRPTAVAALTRMTATGPDHYLTRFAELALARYDAHPVKLLAAYDRLLALHPHESTWILSKTAVLRDLNRMPERMAILESEGSGLTAEPLIAQSLAQMLLPNPHRQEEANWLLRRSVRNRPTAAAGYYLLATQWWEHRRFDDAAEVYRFACTLDDREDQFAEAYFRATRATDQVPEAVRLFQQKAGRATIPAPAATRALFHALMDRDEPEQAFAAIDQAIRKLQESGVRSQESGVRSQESGVRSQESGVRSQESGAVPFFSPKVAAENSQGREPLVSGRDGESVGVQQSLGDLLLFRAECHAGVGRVAAADADVAAAKALVPAVIWHKAAGRVARIKPDLTAAGAQFLEVVKLDPLSAESHRTLTGLLTETDGRAAARTHLAQACQRFPHHYPLLKLRAEFLSGDAEADADRAILDMLDESDRDAWAYRQRALVLADRKRIDEAFAAVNRAGEIEPQHPWYYAVLAQVCKRADRTVDALTAIRTALRANVDQEPLIGELVQLSRGRTEKRAALRFLADELRRQPHTGEGLVAFIGQAHQTYTEPDDHLELLATLEAILDDRQDLWHAWSAVVQQMAVLARLDEAHSLVREATGRFPLLAKLWLDRAQVCHAMGNVEGRLDALRQAVVVAPGWSLAARELADALDEVEEQDDAVIVMERAAARSPLDPFAHGFLSERLWEAGRSREALDRAKTAVRHEPGYDWAWHAVQLWSERLEVPDEPAELARELTRDRAGDPRVWLRLARLLHHPRHNEEVLAALDRAVALDPKNVEAHDLKAERLTEMGKYDDALVAAQPPELAAPEFPFVLQGRVAWVEARRGNYAAAIPPMQALVAVDPSYVWGWHQLAEWYNETGRAQNYLEAASELVRLQPHHPVAWMMRGEAKLQTGDRDAGKSDLRESLKISPGYSHAAAILFDACLADDEIREARQALAVLQEHAAGPEVAVKQIQLATRMDDADSAMRAFAEVCEGPGQSPFPVQAALAELKTVGWEERAQRVLREAWQNGGPFHPWVPIFWIDSPEGQSAEPGERLRAAEAAIKAYPKFMPGHDCKAEQLALAGRFEEALATCRPPDLDPLPIELRSRVAWIENRRGDRGKAITIMRQLVTENPSFVLGWRQLAAWYDAAGRHRECLDATEQFVKLEPTNPVAYVYRGEARRSVADRRGSLGDFQRAFELDPTFEAAGLNLVTEQLATGDVAGAARTLTAVSEHADGPLVRLRGIQVACRQGDFDVAAGRFRVLAQTPETTRGILRDAAMAFDAEGWGPRLTGELRELAAAPDSAPDVAGLWAERMVAAGSPDAVSERLPDLLAANPAAGREVVLAYLWALADSGKPVQGTVTKYSEILRADAPAWARAGGALVATANLAHAAAWLADWRDRDGIEAWMLRPLALAYRGLDQDDKALEVCRAAVKLGGSEEVLADFRSWLALDFALSGQIDEASALIGRVDTVTVPEGTRLVLAMAEAILMVARAGPGAKASALSEAKDHLRSAAGACAPRNFPHGVARAYRKVVRKLAADVGTLGAKLWALWQRFAPWVK